MSNLTLTAQERTKKESRQQNPGKIPAILYGRKIDNKMLWLKEKDFLKVYNSVGESTLVDVKIGDETRSVLIHDLQLHPLTEAVIHVDLYQVRMDEKIETEIELKFTGEAPAVKELGGTLVRNIDKLPVRCLPGNLISELEVDISKLATFDDYIHVKDLNIPAGIEILVEPETVIALVTPPRSQSEIDQLSEEVVADASQVEVAGEKKEEAEEVSAEDKAEEKPAGE